MPFPPNAPPSAHPTVAEIIDIVIKALALVGGAAWGYHCWRFSQLARKGYCRADHASGSDLTVCATQVTVEIRAKCSLKKARTVVGSIRHTQSACGYRTTSFVATLVSKVLAKVNLSWPNRRFVIALHSPNARLETGLRVCNPEKSQENAALAIDRSFLRSPACWGKIAKYGHLSRISG